VRALDRVYTTSELASMIKWPRRKLVRHLIKMDKERGGRLLVNVGTDRRPRWTVTLEALHSAAPQWFNDEETIDSRLEELENARQAFESITAAQNARIGQLVTEVERLKTTVDVMTSSLKAIVGK